jgi:hypothetical protein
MKRLFVFLFLKVGYHRSNLQGNHLGTLPMDILLFWQVPSCLS